MFRYNANTGDFPKLGDRVEVVNSGLEVDGIKGTIGGWNGLDYVIALIALDEPMEDGRTIVAWPVVCLEPVLAIQSLVSQQKKKYIETFESMTSGITDAEGFTPWFGGAKRPVSDDTIIEVKVRGGVKQDIHDAKYWYQIQWMHREVDDPMNKWDIVAYKVIK